MAKNLTNFTKRLRPAQRFWNLKKLGLTPAGSFYLPAICDRPNISCVAFGDIANGIYCLHLVNNGAARQVTLTGFDYLGEPTPYNNFWVRRHSMSDERASRSSYFGIVDLCGIPKDRYYLYKSYWKPEETTIHILPHWNWPDRIGENVPVFDVVYETGTLKAVAYKDGEKLGESVVKTTSDAYELKLTPDRFTIKADGADFSYILIEAFDKDGNTCPLADNKIDIKLSDAGKIAGIGNGNPQSMNGFQSNSKNLFHDKAMLIVKADASKGEIVVEAIADRLKADKVKIDLK